GRVLARLLKLVAQLLSDRGLVLICRGPPLETPPHVRGVSDKPENSRTENHDRRDCETPRPAFRAHLARLPLRRFAFLLDQLLLDLIQRSRHDPLPTGEPLTGVAVSRRQRPTPGTRRDSG